MSGIDERPNKREIPIIESFSIMDWLTEQEPRLMRIDRNEMRRVRRNSARNVIFMYSVLFILCVFMLIWCLSVIIPGIIAPIIVCTLLLMVIKEEFKIYRDNREDDRGEVVEEDLYVWHRGKTD